ncbi:MAG: hypothetical protein HC923_00960 [Myxococcales bacterium]|nr:hypothetical protein [Myxococcales bacterium]
MSDLQRESHGRRRRGLGLLVALGLAGYGTLFFLLADRGPSLDAWRAAADVVRRDHTPSDAILLVPSYATQARELLGDLGPLAVRHPEREDVETRRRVIVVARLVTGLGPLGTSRRSGSCPARKRPSAASRSRLSAIPSQTSRRWSSQRSFQTPTSSSVSRTKASWPAIDAATGPAKVRRDGGGSAREIRSGSTSRAWRHEWATTPAAVPLGSPSGARASSGSTFGYGAGQGRVSWVVNAGHTLSSSRRARAPVMFAVVIGSRAHLASIELRDAWKTLRYSLEGTNTSTVSFGIWSSDAGANHFCFDPEIRRSPST